MFLYQPAWETQLYRSSLQNLNPWLPAQASALEKTFLLYCEDQRRIVLVRSKGRERHSGNERECEETAAEVSRDVRLYSELSGPCIRDRGRDSDRIL
ncbi:hypothetical protein NQZ68_025279 [Dissostichus eleginoides]|nr:hypothetical protein NQZ68_025279 [Dissostichus eleginoides]